MAQISQVSRNQPALPATAALLIFDPRTAVEESERGRDSGPRADPSSAAAAPQLRRVEVNAARLLAAWRAGGGPIIHVQHLSREPASPSRPRHSGCDVKDEVRPRAGEFVIQKSTHDAFIDTGLAPFLAERGIDTLVIAGAVTSHSVEATLRRAGNLGYRAFLATDEPITTTAAALEAR